jgi:hypothetical protein
MGGGCCLEAASALRRSDDLEERRADDDEEEKTDHKRTELATFLLLLGYFTLRERERKRAATKQSDGSMQPMSD